MTKNNLLDKGFISPHRSPSINEGSHNRNLEAGTEVQAIEEYHFLALSSQLAQSAFKTTSPRGTPPRVSWTLPYQLSIKELTPLFAIGWSAASMSSVEVVSFQMVQTCVNLTENWPTQLTICQLDTQITVQLEPYLFLLSLRWQSKLISQYKSSKLLKSHSR